MQSRITIVAEKVEFKPRMNGTSETEEAATAVDEAVNQKELQEKENLAEAALAAAREDNETTVF